MRVEKKKGKNTVNLIKNVDMICLKMYFLSSEYNYRRKHNTPSDVAT